MAAFPESSRVRDMPELGGVGDMRRQEKPPKFKSTYAILDVQQGRNALRKFLAANAGLPVVIHAIITDPYGHDDGTSIEFNVEVVKVTSSLKGQG